jgi:RNA polymerase sigma-B factor
MSQLRDLEKQVLVLFHFESRPQAEIAERLGISSNYVSHILRQSLSKLRKILSTEEEQDRVLRRQAEELDYDSLDPVTGVYTEGFLRHRLEEEVHRAGAEGGSVALVRVNFEGLDDMRKFYGEAAVRDFLADAADFLKKNVRRLDIVARDGETGFAIMLPFTGGTDEVVRERLVNAAAAFTPGRMGPRGGIIVHAGQASVPECGRWASDLYKAAAPK